MFAFHTFLANYVLKYGNQDGLLIGQFSTQCVTAQIAMKSSLEAAYLWNDHSTYHLPSNLQMSMDPMAGEKLPVDSEEDNAINPGALAG